MRYIILDQQFWLPCLSQQSRLGVFRGKRSHRMTKPSAR